MSEPCIMKDELTKMVEKLQRSVKWTLSICVGALLILIISVTTLGGTSVQNSRQIEKINDDYAPLVVLQDMAKDNADLIKIIQMLPNTTKDDLRYINAINESMQFRSEALRRASAVKRSGGK